MLVKLISQDTQAMLGRDSALPDSNFNTRLSICCIQFGVFSDSIGKRLFEV